MRLQGLVKSGRVIPLCYEQTDAGKLTHKPAFTAQPQATFRYFEILNFKQLVFDAFNTYTLKAKISVMANDPKNVIIVSIPVECNSFILTNKGWRLAFRTDAWHRSQESRS
jgi:hypothetical protein